VTEPLYPFYPFAVSGDRATVANTTSDGSVSYQDGYGPDYQLNIDTNPSALPIERTKMNQIFYDVFTNIQQYWQNSVPNFITSALNGGSAFSYGQGVRVLWTDGFIYESLKTSNTDTPATTTSWKLVNSGGSQVIWCGTATGTANSLTLSPAIAPPAYIAGQIFTAIIGTTNTSGTVVGNVSGLGTLNVLKSNGAALVALGIGDLPAGVSKDFIYDGTQLVLLNPRAYSQGAPIASAGTVNLDTSTGDYVQITGTTTWTAITLAQGRQVATEMAGICTITNGSNLILPNAANITTAAGDVYVWRGEASGVVRLVGYCLASGAALIIPTNLNLPGSPTTTTQSPGDNTTKIATTAYVTNAVASVAAFPTGAGAVNTYATAIKTSSSSTTQFGATVAGSTIEPCALNGNTGTTTSLSGTWQCMGFAANGTSSSADATLWLRIA